MMSVASRGDYPRILAGVYERVGDHAQELSQITDAPLETVEKIIIEPYPVIREVGKKPRNFAFRVHGLRRVRSVVPSLKHAVPFVIRAHKNPSCVFVFYQAE